MLGYNILACIYPYVVWNSEKKNTQVLIRNVSLNYMLSYFPAYEELSVLIVSFSYSSHEHDHKTTFTHVRASDY